MPLTRSTTGGAGGAGKIEGETRRSEDDREHVFAGWAPRNQDQAARPADPAARAVLAGTGGDPGRFLFVMSFISQILQIWQVSGAGVGHVPAAQRRTRADHERLEVRQ